jgi:hypothetical protein
MVLHTAHQVAVAILFFPLHLLGSATERKVREIKLRAVELGYNVMKGTKYSVSL